MARSHGAFHKMRKRLRYFAACEYNLLIRLSEQISRIIQSGIMNFSAVSAAAVRIVHPYAFFHIRIMMCLFSKNILQKLDGESDPSFFILFCQLFRRIRPNKHRQAAFLMDFRRIDYGNPHWIRKDNALYSLGRAFEKVFMPERFGIYPSYFYRRSVGITVESLMETSLQAFAKSQSARNGWRNRHDDCARCILIRI